MNRFHSNPDPVPDLMVEVMFVNNAFSVKQLPDARWTLNISITLQFFLLGTFVPSLLQFKKLDCDVSIDIIRWSLALESHEVFLFAIYKNGVGCQALGSEEMELFQQNGKIEAIRE